MAISLTPDALTHVTSFLTSKPEVCGLRVSIKKTGCSGWGYEVDFAAAINPDDQIFDQDGVKLIVDNEALKLIDGTVIDFVQEGINRVFRFKNPNATGECGCGESFTTQTAV